MNEYKRFVFIFLGAAFFISFSAGCKNITEKLTGNTSGKCSVVSVAETKEALSPPTENLQVDIYLDATLSMKGFTETDSFSYYQQTIPLLESSVINTLKGEKFFYKFGNKSEILDGRNYLQSQRPTFYADANFNTKTLIETVLENANPQNLTIVVTDLFQDNADVNQLSDKIKSKFINANLSIGILGIKSQFSGTVYDVGVNPNDSKPFSFPYKTESEETYRPFYILAFGSHSNIARYFDALEQDGVKNFPIKERVILSKNLSERPASFAGADVADKKNINELSGTIVKNDQNLNNFGEFRVKDASKPAVIEVNLPFQKLPGIINFSEQLEPEINSMVCSGGASSFVQQPAIRDALSIDAKTTKPEGINLIINIAPEKIEKDEVNAFHLILRPKQSSLPDWVNEWNMTDAEISDWSRNKNQFNGTKTYNLKHFLQTLWTTTENVHKPKVADFYLYIKP